MAGLALIIVLPLLVAGVAAMALGQRWRRWWLAAAGGLLTVAMSGATLRIFLHPGY